MVKWELDLWYDLWDRAGSQGLDTWYDIGHEPGCEGAPDVSPSSVSPDETPGGESGMPTIG